MEARGCGSRLLRSLRCPGTRGGPLEAPPGFSPAIAAGAGAAGAAARASPAAGEAAARRALARRLLTQRAWSEAIGPAKSLGTNLIMLFFGGSGIFGAIFILYALGGVVTTLANVGTVFGRLEEEFRKRGCADDAVGGNAGKSRASGRGTSVAVAGDPSDPGGFDNFFLFLPQKIVYVFCCLAVGALVLRKATREGLVPIHSADYLALVRLAPQIPQNVDIAAPM